MFKRTSPMIGCLSYALRSLALVSEGGRVGSSRALVCMRALISVTCLTLTLSINPQRVMAQDDSDTSRAVTLHKQAQERYQRGEFEEARELYLQALKLIEHPDLRVRLALVYTALERHSEALENCNKALESRILTEQTRKAAGECVKSAQLRLDEAVAIVESNPSGAKLWLDGSSLGQTPWRGVLSPGRRQFDFELEDHTPTSRMLNVSRGQRVRLNVRLIPLGLGGLLTVRSSPEGANLLLDEDFIGQTPLVSFPTSVGVHQLKVILPGFLPEQRSINMTEGNVQEQMIYMTPEKGRVSATDLWPAWALMGTGALTAVMGGIFGYQALTARNSADTLARSDGTQAKRTEYQLFIRDMENSRTASDILWGTSGVLLTSGLVWWLLSE